MDRETLMRAIKTGPVMVTMNDGSQHIIRSSEFAIVDDIAAHVLPESPTDGKLRSEILSLVCMVRIQHLSEQANER